VRQYAWYRPVALVLLAAQSAGCYHYITPDLGPDAYVSQHEPGQVRVTLTDSTRVVVLDPWITADSLGGRAWLMSGKEPWAVTRDRLVKLEAHEIKTAATVFAVGIPLVVFGAFIGLVTACQGGCGPRIAF